MVVSFCDRGYSWLLLEAVPALLEVLADGFVGFTERFSNFAGRHPSHDPHEYLTLRIAQQRK
jgi:hypothetical protein